jgi:Bacterial capsule synthesis protein PGA_cap
MRENSAHLSRFELARTGNFRAIAYWLNQSLIPAGIYANVGASRQGCVGIWVELPPLQSNNWYLPTLQRQVVRFICHQIWKLNSEAIDGVRIVARLAGQRRILWKQSIRIVTPARRQRQGLPIDPAPASPHPWSDTYDTVIRTMPMVGTATLAFLFGFWVTARHRHTTCDPHCDTESSTPVSPRSRTPQVVDTIDLFGEPVSILAPSPIADANNPAVTLLMTGTLGMSEPVEDGEELTLADVTIANWQQSQMPDLRAAALVEAGVDVVDLASSATMVEEGADLVAALDSLEKAGLPFVGAGRDSNQAQRPTILEVKGRRIAYFSYTTTDGLAAGDDRLGLNFSDRDRLAEEIRGIGDRVDWVVVNLHWDGELSETPDPWQIDLAHWVVDAGADLVVGYHPQVLQGAEIYRDRPIVYALSDVIFGEPLTRDFETAAIEVSLKGDQMKIEVLPLEVRGFQPRIAEGGRGRAILERFEDRSTTFDRPMPLSTILTLPPHAAPVEASEFPEAKENLEAVPDTIPDGSEADFGHMPESWRPERAEPETEWNPEAPPEREKSDPFIQDPFISVPQESDDSDSSQSHRWEFPRWRLPFERQSAPENPDARQSQRLIDLPPFVRGNRTTPSFPARSFC